MEYTAAKTGIFHLGFLIIILTAGRRHLTVIYVIVIPCSNQLEWTVILIDQYNDWWRIKNLSTPAKCLPGPILRNMHKVPGKQLLEGFKYIYATHFLLFYTNKKECL